MKIKPGTSAAGVMVYGERTARINEALAALVPHGPAVLIENPTEGGFNGGVSGTAHTPFCLREASVEYMSILGHFGQGGTLATFRECWF